MLRNAIQRGCPVARMAVARLLMTGIPLLSLCVAGWAAEALAQQESALDIPDAVRIVEPLAWNRTDKYVEPDFDSFFPDDLEGAKQLDDFHLRGEHDVADVLAVVRRGLRNTSRHRTTILSHVGKRYIWNVEEQNSRAMELMYHASDAPRDASHYAMYFGLTVANRRSANLMRTIVERYHSYGDGDQHRIVWGFNQYGDRSETEALLLAELDRLASQQPSEQRSLAIVAASTLYNEFTGNPVPNADRFESLGRFVVGYRHQGCDDEQSLRAQFSKWLGDDATAIQDHVMRIADGNPVGVALISGIRHRDIVCARIERDPAAVLEFCETFIPRVLTYRQLREFAKHLAEGLPQGARPPYEPPLEGEVFAWNRTDVYQPPNFREYFPDDAEGGARLDQLYANREQSEFAARKTLEHIRRGLRRCTIRPNLLMSWANNVAGWPSDPMATEISYQAADPQAPVQWRYNAVYFGLRGRWNKPPNFLRLCAELISSESTLWGITPYAVTGSILGSLRDDKEKQAVAKHLAETLRRHRQFSPAQLHTMTYAYEHLTKQLPANFAEYAQRGRFIVLLRPKGKFESADAAKLAMQQEFDDSPYWIDVIVKSGDQHINAIAIVRGMAGMKWLLGEIDKGKEYSLDYYGPLLKRFGQSTHDSHGFPELAEYVEDD